MRSSESGRRVRASSVARTPCRSHRRSLLRRRPRPDRGRRSPQAPSAGARHGRVRRGACRTLTGGRAYLALGSNLGDRLAYLQHALDELAARDDTQVVALSRVYETSPVGGPEQGVYLNAVVAIDTTLAPHDLLAVAHEIEA